jgi:hypothetical protein
MGENCGDMIPIHPHERSAAAYVYCRRLSPHPDLWELANAYVAAGMKEKTFQTLFQGLQTHEPGLLQIRVDPDFDSIRKDSRYLELVRKIGFPNE